MKDYTKPPAPPRPPLDRLIILNGNGFCEKCGSSLIRNWFGLGKIIGCCQKWCSNFCGKEAFK